MNTIDLLFSWFIAATVRGSLLTLAVLAVEVSFGGRMPARWRYALWLPVIFVLVSPVLPASRWSLENLSRARNMRAKPSVPQSLPPVAPISNVVVTGPERALPGAGIDWREIMALGWLAGSAGVLILALGSYARTMRVMRRGTVPADAALGELLMETAAACGSKRPPRLLISSAVASPAVTGLLRPLLLIPAGFPCGFRREEARLILLHELTHIRRGDVPLNWLLCLAQALHWCNPLLWFAMVRLRSDREAACDAGVLAMAGADCREDYGRALLALEGALPLGRASLGIVGIFERGAGLRARIKAIATHRHAHPAWAALGAALIAGMFLAGATRATEAAPLPKTPGESPEAPSQAKRATEAMLKNSIIPTLEFRETFLAEDLALLQKKSVELDPNKRGVSIALKDPAFKGRPITVSLTNIPLLEALKYITSLADCAFKITDREVIVFPVKALGINIPKLEIQKMSVEDAIEDVRVKARKFDPDGKGVAVVISPDARPAAKNAKVTLKLENVSVSQAMDAVIAPADLELELGLGEDTITIYRPELEVSEWDISPGPLADSIRDARKFAESKGVAFPSGSSISWDPVKSKLVMKNTPRNNGRISEAVDRAKQEVEAQATIVKAQNITIPKVDLVQATITEAARFLTKESSERDSEHRGLNVVVLLEADPKDTAKGRQKFDVHLTNTTLWDALQAVARVADLDVHAYPQLVAFQLKGQAP